MALRACTDCAFAASDTSSAIAAASAVAPAGNALIGLWWHPLGTAATAGMVLLLTGGVARAPESGRCLQRAEAALLALAITIAYLAAAVTG
jgi:hypothetical protein